MSVTGDFGNQIFNRKFIPSENEYVSDTYWDEKLRTCSQQKSHYYCHEKTGKLIEDFANNFSETYGREPNYEEKQWLNLLKKENEENDNYLTIAYNELPNTIDSEDIPYGEERHFWLNAVYDGFDLICKKTK